MNKLIILALLVVFVVACVQKSAEIANPASVYCEEHKGTLEIRSDENGSQSGYCHANGKECDEWAYYRGECTLE